MRKILALLMAIITLASLAACGGDGSTPHGNNPPPDMDETPVKEFAYKYDATTQGIEITKYTGTSIKVRIPKKIDDEPVTNIGEEAFRDSGIMSVYIPDTVVKISEAAFRDCAGLTSIALPAGLTEIGDAAFMRCENLTSVVIPDSVTEIGYSAFAETALTSIAIPGGLNNIASNAFSGTGLTSVEFGSGLTTIGGLSGTLLTSVVIPDGVTTIGPSAFAETALASVVIPDSVTTIGAFAFFDTALTSVVIPDSVTTIHRPYSSVFSNNPNLTSITFRGITYGSNEGFARVVEDLIAKGELEQG
ncbi:MAG: leucine-rich repeat domain-containing protein [Oscillospiraceae bacterium]|nr:leucine-rich repeat domain-containing protein [Oscillospiraceae bacterium]